MGLKNKMHDRLFKFEIFTNILYIYININNFIKQGGHHASTNCE